MAKLEDIAKDAQVRGLHGDEVGRIVNLDKIGDSAVRVVYQKCASAYSELLSRAIKPEDGL